MLKTPDVHSTLTVWCRWKGGSVRATCAGLCRALAFLAPIVFFQAGCGAGDIIKPSPSTSEVDKAPAPVTPDVALSLPVVLPDPGSLTLRIFDMEGHVVRVIKVTLGAGTQELTWDGRNNAGFPVGSSVYVYQLVMPGGEVIVGRLVLAR